MASLLGLTIGALEIGVLLSTALYGFSAVQAYVYTERPFKDPLWLRGMILFVWTCDTIHTTLAWAFLYFLTVTNYGIPAAIAETPWSLALILPMTSCIGASVQVFFAWRVRVLGGQLIILLIAGCGALLRVSFSLIGAASLRKSGSIVVFFSHYQWISDTMLALDMALDLMNTGALCYYLIRRRTGAQSTQRVVDKLILYSVETGFITSICTVAVLACSLAMPDNFVFLSIFLVYPKVLSNSFLASLNTRQNLRQQSSTGSRAVWSNEESFDTHISHIGSRTIGLESDQNSHYGYSARIAGDSLVPPAIDAAISFSPLKDFPAPVSPPALDNVLEKDISS